MTLFSDAELIFIENEHTRWFSDRGDDVLRLNYPLDGDSIVFDVGGWCGQWSELIYNKYKPYIYIIEPVRQNYNVLIDKFKSNQKIKIIKAGVGNNNRNTTLNLNEDGSSEFVSMVNESQQFEKEIITIRNFSEMIDELGVKKIDLMKINIEGGEYDAIPNLIENKKLDKIQNLQIQFHHNYIGIQDTKEARKAIRDKLSLTHKLTWCYDFVWENWTAFN